MDVHDLTAAYALDALDSDERESFEAHLAQCAQCQRELASLGETASALAFAIASPPPPAQLRERILKVAAAERENVVPLPMRRQWLTRSVAVAASVAACAAIGLGVWAATLSNSLDHARAKSASAQAVAQVLANPSAQRIALKGRNGVVAVEPSGRAVLVINGLAKAPTGHTYEAWVIPSGGMPHKAGLFQSNGTQTFVPLADVPKGAVVAATVERSGGVDAPTTTPVLSAQT